MKELPELVIPQRMRIKGQLLKADPGLRGRPVALACPEIQYPRTSINHCENSWIVLRCGRRDFAPHKFDDPRHLTGGEYAWRP